MLYDAFIGQFALFASWLTEHPYLLTLFGTDIGVDPLAIGDLQTVLRNKHGITKLQYNPVNSTRELLATMATMDYVVTCRFHGVVLAHLLNKPVLAISHHPKVLSLMKDIGFSSYCVDIRKFEASVLQDMFVSLVGNATEIKSRMAEKLASNRSELTIQFDTLFPRGMGK